MPHSRLYDAIVLRSIDVGEADRFLILLTRQLGRVAALAAGARRPTSKLLGILPGRRLQVELIERPGSFLVTSLAPVEAGFDGRNVVAFSRLQQGMELLLG